MAHPNEEIARRAFEAFHKDRDSNAISQYFAEDLEYHLGGDTAVSGDRKGRAALVAGRDRVADLGIDASYELHDVVANDEHVVMLISSRAGSPPTTNLLCGWPTWTTARSPRSGRSCSTRPRSRSSSLETPVGPSHVGGDRSQPADVGQRAIASMTLRVGHLATGTGRAQPLLWEGRGPLMRSREFSPARQSVLSRPSTCGSSPRVPNDCRFRAPDTAP